MLLLKVVIGILGLWALVKSVSKASEGQDDSAPVVMFGVLGAVGLIGAFLLPMGRENPGTGQAQASVVAQTSKPEINVSSSTTIPRSLPTNVALANEAVSPSNTAPSKEYPYIQCEKHIVNGKEQKDITVQTATGTFAVNGTARTRAAQKGWKDGKKEFDPPVLLKFLNEGMALCNGGTGAAVSANEATKSAPAVSTAAPGDKLTVTGLGLAARKGDLPTIQRYIDGKFNLNAKTPKDPSKYSDGTTAVVEAAAEGKCDALKLLLNAGAKPDIDTKYGFTPLFHAASRGHTECVKSLLAKKARVDVRTEPGGDTALIMAAYAGHLESVKLLVQAGASRKIVNKDNDNALEAAKSFGNNSIVRYLSVQ